MTQRKTFRRLSAYTKNVTVADYQARTPKEIVKFRSGYFTVLMIIFQGMKNMKAIHNTVATGKSDFFGWSSNHGIRKFGNELPVGFEKGIHHYNDPDVYALD